MNIVTMPRLGVTMQIGKVVFWYKSVGESVEKGELLFELETEKSTVEIESPYTGILRAIMVEEGVETPVGEPLAVIAGEHEEIDIDGIKAQFIRDTSKEEQAEVKPNEEKIKNKAIQTGRRIKAVPKARKLAAELGIPLEEIEGTGPDGLITEEDVRNAVNITKGSVKKLKLNNIQKVMSQNMLNSWQNIPQFTQIISVNANNLLKVKEEAAISINDIIVKVVANVVKNNPLINSRLEGDEILVFENVNISVAMITDKGLIVPVVKKVEEKPAAQVAQEIKELYQKAVENKLSMEELSDGTITVSNLGKFGIECGTPIINPPQSTIVFVGTIKKVPGVNEQGVVEASSIMQLSIAFDHRFIDGASAAHFTSGLKQELENLTVDVLE